MVTDIHFWLVFPKPEKKWTVDCVAGCTPRLGSGQISTHALSVKTLLYEIKPYIYSLIRTPKITFISWIATLDANPVLSLSIYIRQTQQST